MESRSLLASGRPGECRMYSDWWTSSLSSQKHLYTERTLDGCSPERCSGAPAEVSQPGNGECVTTEVSVPSSV